MIERDKEYEIKVTGEEIAILALLVSNCNGGFTNRLWPKLLTLINNPDLEGLIYTTGVRTIQLYNNKHEINEYINSIFPKPETEEERNIRELKEQYALLGDKIKQMENK